MLTVTHGRKSTRRHILVYTVLMVPVALALAFTPIGGPVYLATSVVMNAGFLYGAWRIVRRDEGMAEADRYKVEKQVFSFSLLYLFTQFGALLVEAVLHGMGYGAL
jgi:protoheme IX farnesyltransferase